MGFQLIIEDKIDLARYLKLLEQVHFSAQIKKKK